MNSYSNSIPTLLTLGSSEMYQLGLKLVRLYSLESTLEKEHRKRPWGTFLVAYGNSVILNANFP